VGSYTPHRFIVLVARYKKRFPGASIWVEFANSQALAKKVLNYELDVAVTAREHVLPSFHSLAFTSDTLIVLAPKGPAWERRRSISVKELKRQVIVCREPGSSSRSAADRLIDAAGLHGSIRETFSFHEQIPRSELAGEMDEQSRSRSVHGE
jgi:LysR family transcriptional regulator, low CO2-responsive transcriptional regulator